MSSVSVTAADDDVHATTADGVLTITLAAEASRNVLGIPLMEAVRSLLGHAAADPKVRSVVLTNAGTVFCAGADLKAAPGNAAPEIFTHLLRELQTCPKPVVGRIAGHVVGGGMGLAAACDISIAAADAQFGFSEVRLGVAPAVVSVVCLPKMRRVDAQEAFLRGARFPAGRAAEMGLITRAVPRASLDAEIEAVLADLRLGGPEALAAAKSLVGQAPATPPEEAFAAMAALSARLFASPEGQAGAQAFRERRPAPWAE